MRRVSSLLVSLVAGIGGFTLLFWAAGTFLLIWGEFTGGYEQLLPPALGVVFGSLLIGVASYAVRWSALGPIVLGSLALIFSLMNGLANATALGLAGSSPFSWVLRLSFDMREIGSGAYSYLTTGFGVVAGLLLIVTAIVGRTARTPSGGGRVLSAVAGILVAAALLAAAAAGSEVMRAIVRGMTFAAGQLMPLLVFVALVAAAVALIVAVRWSTLVLWLPGVLLTLVGIVMLFGPSASSMLISLGVRPNGSEQFQLVTGLILLGLAAGIRSRRTHPTGTHASGGMDASVGGFAGSPVASSPPYGGPVMGGAPQPGAGYPGYPSQPGAGYAPQPGAGYAPPAGQAPASNGPGLPPHPPQY